MEITITQVKNSDRMNYYFLTIFSYSEINNSKNVLINTIKIF